MKELGSAEDRILPVLRPVTQWLNGLGNSPGNS